MLINYKNKMNKMLKINLVGSENIQVQIEEGQKIKDIKKKLIELGYEINGINFICKGNILNDNDDLSLKGIHSNSTIVYYFSDGRKIKKNPDFKKIKIAFPEIKTDKSVHTENKDEDEGKDNNQNNQNEEKENKEKKKEDDEEALLKKYSSIIKISTYKKNKEDTEKILTNLKSLKNDIYQKICGEKKDSFFALLEKPIDQTDLNIVKANYKDFIELIEDKNKININLTAEETEFIKTQMSKYRMDKEQVILSYINNKFDQEKTINELNSLQNNKK